MATSSKEDKNFNLFSLQFFQDLLPKHKTDTQAPIRPKDFSRERRLTLPVVLSLIINMIRPGKRFGYQEVLNRFYSDTGLTHQEGSNYKPPDKGAFCRARQKLPLDLFQELFGFVTKAQEMAAKLGETTWHGFRVLAIDGTKKTMPYSEQLEAFFGIPSGSSFPQMLTCVLYDVLAKVPLDAVYGPFATSERTMARLLYKDLKKSDLLLMDRGFPSFEVLSEMLSLGFQFMVRLPITGLFKEIRAFLDKGRVDGMLTIHPPASLVKELRKQGKPIPAPICLRVVKINAGDESWEEPTDLTRPIPPAPAFPMECLPYRLANYARDESERMQAAVDLIAIPMLVTCGGLIGKDASIRPKNMMTGAKEPVCGGLVSRRQPH